MNHIVFHKLSSLASGVLLHIKIRNLVSVIGLACFLFVLPGCNLSKVYDKSEDIPKYIWNQDFKPSFTVTMEDTAYLYNIYVNVRHTKFYPFSNLWIMIHTTFPDGRSFDKRVELPLADKEGKWYGDCLGDICDLRIPIQNKAFFEMPGAHQFEFEQIMRQENLPFVMSMGLRIEKAE